MLCRFDSACFGTVVSISACALALTRTHMSCLGTIYVSPLASMQYIHCAYMVQKIAFMRHCRVEVAQSAQPKTLHSGETLKG